MDEKAILAIEEAKAQVRVTTALSKVAPENRGRVLEAVKHLVAADALVPGVLKTYLQGKAAAGRPDCNNLAKVTSTQARRGRGLGDVVG